jgi:hypothetical protein
MRLIKATLATATVAAGLTAGAMGFGAVVANADPPPPPPLPAEAGAPAPDWAPPRPDSPLWAPNNPVVWDPGWGGRWGIWINGQFLTLT